MTTKIAFNQIEGMVVNVKDYGAVGDGVADDTEAMQAAIDYVKTLTRPSAIYVPAGNYLLSDQGSGYCLSFDAFGITLFGDGPWSTVLKCVDTATDIIRISSDETTLCEYCTIRDLRCQGTQTGSPTTVGINAWAAPSIKLSNILMLDMYDGLKLKNAWNASVDTVRIFDTRNYAFDVRDNTNDTCFINCIGEGLPSSSPPATMRLESSHGVSIQGGAYENADYAFEIIASEVSIDCYVEKCAEGVINGSAATSARTLINIVNMYSFNNAEAKPLFKLSAGIIQVHQLNDSPSPSTIAGSVFELTGGAKAYYGFMAIDSTTVLGSFASGSGGWIRPLHPAPMLENISTINSSNVASTEYIGRANRPWKIQRVEIYRLTGDISGANIQIGNTTDPDSLANFTLANSAFQVLTFETSPTEGMYQTTGSYTNQTGYFILTNDGGGSAGTFQVVFRYYSGYAGSSSLPALNDVDAFISAENGGLTSISVQFMD